MRNEICGNCKHFNGVAYCLYRKGGTWGGNMGCGDFADKDKPTNGDRIRQMSNEEFARLRVYHCPPVPAEFCKGTDTVKCVKCWLNWLNAPAESEEGKNEP